MTSDPISDPIARAKLASLHPDCPDWQRLGPTPIDALIRAAATAQQGEAQGRESAWSKGFNRRRLLANGMGIGVAALGAQLVTSRVSYAATNEEVQGTLVVIFLRGGIDGLSVLVPAEDPNLLNARPDIAVRGGSLIDLGRGFGLHPSLAPLKPLISAGQLAAVPAISTPDLSRSHFQAQDCLERGSTTGARSGWLDRVLAAAGPGTTFRGLSVGSLLPRSMFGDESAMSLRALDALEIKDPDNLGSRTSDALEALYTGLDHPIAAKSLLALDAVATMQKVRGAADSSAAYPDDAFGRALSDLAVMIKAQVGVRVACIDVGGWDMHTEMGNVDYGDMTDQLADLAAALAVFTSDLGDQLSSTTIITMSEFGRRVTQNASGGTDHGHGGVLLAMGGGVKGGVHGTWEGLGSDVLDQGDVPGSNDYRDALSEIVSVRLGIGMGAMGTVFPDWDPSPPGLMA